MQINKTFHSFPSCRNHRNSFWLPAFSPVLHSILVPFLFSPSQQILGGTINRNGLLLSPFCSRCRSRSILLTSSPLFYIFFFGLACGLAVLSSDQTLSHFLPYTFFIRSLSFLHHSQQYLIPFRPFPIVCCSHFYTTPPPKQTTSVCCALEFTTPVSCIFIHHSTAVRKREIWKEVLRLDRKNADATAVAVFSSTTTTNTTSSSITSAVATTFLINPNQFFYTPFSHTYLPSTSNLGFYL